MTKTAPTITIDGDVYKLKDEELTQEVSDLKSAVKDSSFADTGYVLDSSKLSNNSELTENGGTRSRTGAARTNYINGSVIARAFSVNAPGFCFCIAYYSGITQASFLSYDGSYYPCDGSLHYVGEDKRFRLCFYHDPADTVEFTSAELETIAAGVKAYDYVKTELGDLDEIRANASAALNASLVPSRIEPVLTIANGVGAAPFIKSKVYIEPNQAGAGAVSVDNVRPIIGRTDIRIIVSPTNDAADGMTYICSVPSQAGIVYRGRLEIDKTGDTVLTITHGLVTYTGAEAWKSTTSGGQRYYVNLPDDAITDASTDQYLSSAFPSTALKKSGNSGTWGNHLVVGGTMIKVLDKDAHFADLAAFKTWLADLIEAGTPFQVMYPLADEVVYRFNTEPIASLSDGTFNVWSDSGSIQVEYAAKSSALYHGPNVPDYYLKDSYLQDKIADIEAAMNSSNGNAATFIYLTDAHWNANAKNSPALVKYISERIPIQRLFLGGDLSEGIDLDAVHAFREAFGERVYTSIGNHEYHNYFRDVDGDMVSYTITDAHLWNYYTSRMMDCFDDGTGRNYYYVDDNARKIRFIVLNDFVGGSTESIEPTQQTWLSNTALNMPDGFAAVVFAHEIVSVNHSTGATTLSEAGATIASILDGYTGGDIAAVICGHRHFDGIGATPGGIPIFVTTCDKYRPVSGYDDWIAETRIRGTVSEQAFDVFVIDKANKTVTAVRIGCPADNPSGNPLEARTAQYG